MPGFRIYEVPFLTVLQVPNGNLVNDLITLHLDLYL